MLAMNALSLKKCVATLFLLTIGFLLGSYFPYLSPSPAGSSSFKPLPITILDVPQNFASDKTGAQTNAASRIQTQVQLSNSAENNLPATDNETENNQPILFNSTESLGRISNTIEQNPELDLASELLTRFEREEVDVAWAYQQEIVVRDLFLDHPALADISPNSIECKTNRCRIQLPLVNIIDGNGISMAISSAISSSPEFSKYSIAAGFNYERAVLDIYLPRDAGFNLMQ
jgi:hypothetical protein